MASEKNELKIKELNSALSSFENSLKIDTSTMNEITTDAIFNGQIQKFEYTLELLWKTCKSHIKETGIDLNSPKSVLRHVFTFSQLSDQEKESTLAMIDDRNKIAHEYKDYIMEVIHPKLKDYAVLMRKIADIKIQ